MTSPNYVCDFACVRAPALVLFSHSAWLSCH